MLDKPFCVLVCGGRNYLDRDAVYRELYRICDERNLWSWPDELGNQLPGPIRIVTGGCRTGADSFAIDWSIINWTPFVECPADWSKHGRAAGPMRNQAMLDAEKPDVVLAFPGGRGTRDMVSRAKAVGLAMRVIPEGAHD